MGRRRFLHHALALGGFACSGGVETPARPATRERTPASPLSAFGLITYNVLADPVHLEQRLPPLFRVLRTLDAEVIALQEVAPWFLQAMEREAWLSDYHFAEVDGRGADRGGQAILSRWPLSGVRSVPLPGRQQRTVLLADVAVPGADAIVVATTHMESFLEDGPVRARQLDVIFAELNARPASGGRIFCGDVNFGDGEEPDSAHLDPSYVDAWNEVRPGLPGYTWNIEASEMAREGSFVGEGSRRLDRVLIRSSRWAARNIRIIGETPLTADRTLFPSDHFGLHAEIQRIPDG